MDTATGRNGGILPKFIIGVVLGVVVVAGFLLISDWRQVSGSIATMPKGPLLVAFLLTLMSYLFRLGKWHAFSRWSGFSVPFRKNAAIFFIGLMMSITPGKAGELIKSYYLKETSDIPYSASIPVVFYDRLTDLLAMAALVAVGLLVYPFGITPFLATVVLISGFFFLAQRQGLMKKMIDLLTRPDRLRRFRGSLHHFYQQTLYLMQFRILSFAFVVSVLAWLSECIALFVILGAFNQEVSILASILTFSLGTLAGAVSMIPGGLGAAEGSITGLLIHFGVGGSLAVSISLIVRFVTLWFGVLIGFVVFLFRRKAFRGTNITV
ncbi:lysylphosphatidylglycerol synthase transmembrane domain-containing protein [Virgibacillus sediminis]|uniref:Phosphatidylglycerol lysyltransferase n=1 Tax=Virgibacillus sediminis TaxID=202260 RepID=A0ABV7A3R6_9BACI